MSALLMKKKTTRSKVPFKPNEEDIRRYAYHLYQQSNYMSGHDLDNWLEATACLRANIPANCSHRRLHVHMIGEQIMEPHALVDLAGRVAHAQISGTL